MKNTHAHDHWQDGLPHILQLAGIGMWELLIFETGATMNFSRSVKDMYGYADGSLEGKWTAFLERVCHPEYREALQERIAGAAGQPGGIFDFEFPAWSNNTNDWRWVYIFGQSAAVPEQRLVRLFGGVQDIHERRTQQKQLERQQQEALQTIALQKAVLEQQIRERTELLHDVQTRVSSILGATSPVAPAPAQKPHQSRDIYDEVDVLFAEGLHKAFDVITEKMSWYKAVIDSIPFPIAVTDMGNRWMYLNSPGLEAANAASLGELFGHPAARWSSAESKDESALAAHSHFLFHQEEHSRVYRGQASNLFDSAGNIIGHIETMQDITEVYAADERTKLMLDAMPLGCAFWDKDCNKIDCNDAIVSLFEAPDKETFLAEFYNLSPSRQPDGSFSSPLAKEQIKKAFETGYNHFEWIHETFSGERVPVDVTLVRIKWRGNYVVVGYLADLRKLKAAQAELDKERLLLKDILDSSPVCVMILVNRVIRFITPFTSEFLGAAVGDSILKYHESEEQARLIKEEISRTRRLDWRPMTLRDSSGGVHEMLGNAIVSEYYGEEALILWLVDVTEMRAKERELLLAKDAAEESTKAKSEFLANMSHEIRTPMNAILGMTHLLMRTELNPKQRDYLEKAEHSGKSLLRIINDILDFSKIEAGRLEMERVPFSVEGVFRDVLAVVAQQARDKGLELLLEVPADMPEKVEGDPLRLRQILLNLASNAVKFTGKGSISLGVSILRTDGNAIVLDFSVADTGIGMSKSQIAKLFSPFTQADTSTTRQYGGTGLGLAISKRLVEMMHGAIWCESAQGKGTTFRFTARFGAVKSTSCYSAAHFSKMEVLLLGDNLPGLAILRPMLQSLGCVVSTAAGKEQGTALLLRSAGFDLLIINDTHPENSVPETLAFLREKTRKQLPPSLLVLADEPAAEEKAQTLGASGALVRPVTPSSLLNSINSLMNDDAPDTRPRENCADSALAALAPYKGKHILLAEDNPINQMVAQELLEIAGFTVDIADNGREAVEMALQNSYALILMDIQMPEMDGFTAAGRLRATSALAGTPIIAMTALAMQGDREKSLAAGMDDHVTKPIDAAELYAALARWLPGRK